ncbi:MAG: phage holin family protein [Anaerolineales bacterium]|nr:phage holin family protein [Anaerolineales bacterium]
MVKLILRWAINAVALWAAVSWVPGISGPANDWVSLFGLALVFGLINALLRPLLTLLTCPLLILTLGLGTLLLNTFLFWLTSVVSQSLSTQFGLTIGFTVDGFWPAFFGALVVSIVSVVLSLFIRDDGEERRRWRRRRERE